MKNRIRKECKINRALVRMDLLSETVGLDFFKQIGGHVRAFKSLYPKVKQLLRADSDLRYKKNVLSASNNLNEKVC